jgi:hypothetical protein
MTKDAGFQQNPPTSSFPKDHLIGVIDNLQEAQQAAQALQGAGFEAKDIRLYSSQDFPEAMQQKQQQKNPLSQAVHDFFISSDQGGPDDIYVAEARLGHHILAVYIQKPEQVDPARTILTDHHAHLIKYIGDLTTTDFPS